MDDELPIIFISKRSRLPSRPLCNYAFGCYHGVCSIAQPVATTRRDGLPGRNSPRVALRLNCPPNYPSSIHHRAQVGLVGWPGKLARLPDQSATIRLPASGFIIFRDEIVYNLIKCGLITSWNVFISYIPRKSLDIAPAFSPEISPGQIPSLGYLIFLFKSNILSKHIANNISIRFFTI